MDKYTVAKLELKWQEGALFGWRGRYLDFVVDGCRFRERIPWAEVATKELGKYFSDEPIQLKKYETHVNYLQQTSSSYPTPLGHFHKGSDRWWQEALSELLLEKPPRTRDGGCPLFTCPGCPCHYVSARIERENGFFLWRHFTVGGAAYPDPVDIDLGPFYFEERNYVETLEWARKELMDASSPFRP
jgi:hypothetical protein